MYLMNTMITHNRVKLQPCPHCGNRNETNYCYGFTSDEGNLLSVCKRGAEPGEGWEKSGKTDSAGDSIYYLKRDKKFSEFKKEKTTYYAYPKLANGTIVQVYRKDYQEDGRWKKEIRQQHSTNNGKTWNWNLQGINYSEIPLYHAERLKKAIGVGTPILVVEGENKVEKLEAMGFVATCSLGGAGKWQPSHSEFLKGAKLILCPDRDNPGVKHVQRIYQDFPDARFLYAYPDSPLWDHLPESGGCDLIDWIEETKATKEQVLAGVVDTPKELRVREPKSKPTEQLLSLEDIVPAIDAAIEQHLTLIKWEAKIHEWAKLTGKTPSDIRELKKARERELEESERIDTGITDFLQNNHYRQDKLDIFKIVPRPLAEALDSRAKTINQPSIRLLHSLWPVMGAILGSRFAVNLRTARNSRNCWKESPIFYMADVDYPSGGKTTTQKQIYRVLKERDKVEQMRVDQEEVHLEDLKSSWAEMTREERKENITNPSVNPRLYEREHCKAKRWVYDHGTLDAILKSISLQSPWQGSVWLADELTGLFDGMNQYKSGGKGSDRQKLLEAWNDPLQFTFDRVNRESRYSMNGQTLNILGGIQVGKLRKYLDLSDDVDGLVSRFHFLINEPLDPVPGRPPMDENSVEDLILEAFNRVSGIELEIGESGVERYDLWFTEKGETFAWDVNHRYNNLVKQNRAKNPAFTAYIGKQMKEFLRFAITIHLLNWIYDPEHTDLYKIPVQTAAKAAAVTDFYINQFLAIQGITGGDDQNPIQGILHEIWEIVRTFGKITTREVHQKFQSRKIDGQKMNSGLALELLSQLQKAGHGRLEGKTLHFQEPQAIAVEEIVFEEEEFTVLASEQKTEPPRPEEYSADGVHLDSLPNFERQEVLIRTAEPIDTGERTIPTRTIARIVGVTIDTIGNWLIEAEARIGEAVARFSLPFGSCYVNDVGT